MIDKYGLDHYLQKNTDTNTDSITIGRVVSQQSRIYHAAVDNVIISAQISGKFKYNVEYLEDYPVVGDFIEIVIADNDDSAIIKSVLPRYSAFYRKANDASGAKFVNGIIESGSTEAQVLAGNIDTVFIICGLDGDYNLHRLERYILSVAQTDAKAVIVLNKVDLCENPEKFILEVKQKFPECDVAAISALENEDIEQLSHYFIKGHTLLFTGSSGVGKSTLLNTILHEQIQATKTTNEKTGRGRHATTGRELFLHPDGFMIIDIPGIRELQLWTDSGNIDRMFEDVVDLIAMCRFSNCSHKSEPGCAVKQAIEDGTITVERYDYYIKYSYEVKRLEQKKKARERMMSRKRDRRR